MKALVRMMGEYNRWANERLFHDCSQLTEEQLTRDFGSEYPTIHATLDHGLLVDRIWLDRFSNRAPVYVDFETKVTSSFADLAKERSFTDEDLSCFINGVSEARLLEDIRYTTIREPETVTQPLGSSLLHVFHHQCHYRGQVHAFLHMLGLKPRNLDLLHFQRQTRLGGMALA
ncbi:DinB family protein [Roseibium sp.]|uniref:DinB family protein n=1 Tax=Roseibium sp. TaxID=1936156 RepID=UPI003A9872F0